NLFTLDAVSVEMALGAAGRDHAEAHPLELADRRHDLVLVRVLDRDAHSAGQRQLRAAAELALGERDGLVPGDAHLFAGRAHLRSKPRVQAWEAGEGKPRLLHRDMI